MERTSARLYARLRDEQFAVFESYARKNGMNGKSMMVLLWIYYHKSGLTQEQIAKRTHSTKQVVQAIIKGFMEKGILLLDPCIEDKRKKYVRLTEYGEVYAAGLLEPLEKYEEQAMNALTREQQEALIEGTRIFSEQLKLLLKNHWESADD